MAAETGHVADACTGSRGCCVVTVAPVQPNGGSSSHFGLHCRVRCAYKGVQNLKDLEKELPQCHLGVLLLLWIKQVRKVARKAGMLREAEQQLTAAEQAKSNKDKELEAAKEAKVRQRGINGSDQFLVQKLHHKRDSMLKLLNCTLHVPFTL